MIDLDAVFDDDRAPGTAPCEQREPAAVEVPATADWRAELSEAERRLFPAGLEPPAQFIADVLAMRRVFGVEIESVERPSAEPDRAGVWAGDLPADWREAYEERTGIMEFDANMPRADAERAALVDTLLQMRAAGVIEPVAD